MEPFDLETDLVRNDPCPERLTGFHKFLLVNGTVNLGRIKKNVIFVMGWRGNIDPWFYACGSGRSGDDTHAPTPISRDLTLQVVVSSSAPSNVHALRFCRSRCD